MEGRLETLASIFAIDVIGFSIMSTHFHVILRNRPDIVMSWSDTEVARRWLMLCPFRKDKNGMTLVPTGAELDTIRNDPNKLREIRSRLSNISWWMRMIAEPTARRSNKEDQTTGRFWQGRFTGVKLCDEAAVLACLAYVDLNPIRAGIAKAPETSDYTSAQRRIQSLTEQNPAADQWLAPFELDESEVGPLESASSARASDKGCVPMSIEQYLELLDWTGRQLVSGKRGVIPGQLAPILERIGVVPDHWLVVAKNFGRIFYRVAGGPQTLQRQNFRRRFRSGRAELLGAT